MRWLVVTIHLGDHGIAVLVVVQQCVVAPLGGGGGGKDANLALGGAQHNLLAPVTKDVGLNAGGGFGAVVGVYLLEFYECRALTIFGHGDVVEELLL